MSQIESMKISQRQKSERSHMWQMRIRQSLFAWSLILIPLLYFLITWYSHLL